MIKRLQNGFRIGSSTERDGCCLAVSAAFLSGAAIAACYICRSGAQYCTSILSRSAAICAAIVMQTIILGCSVIGGTVLPVCSALYGALVCFCSAAVRLQGKADAKHIAIFVVMTPVFFSTASEGIFYADLVSECRYLIPAESGSEKFVVYACAALFVTAVVLRAAYF